MSKKVLVVDDQASMLKLYSRLLSGTRHSFTLAGSFTEAKGLLSANAYDLVITDLQLGDGSGLELIALANGAGCPRTMMVSGAFDPDELEFMALRHGVPAFFCKPFNADTLLKTVERLLSD